MTAPLDLNAIEARERKAHDMVSRLCNSAQTGQRWVMHIPARPDSDPDLVIGAALLDVPALLAEVRRLRAELDEARAVLLPEAKPDPAFYGVTVDAEERAAFALFCAATEPDGWSSMQLRGQWTSDDMDLRAKIRAPWLAKASAVSRERVEECELALRTIATYEQDERPPVGDPSPHDWRRRAEKLEALARDALAKCAGPKPTPNGGA